MNSEIEQILESLPEEQKTNFYEKVKKQAQEAVKLVVEEKKKEEEQKQFKATGHWETEDDELKITLDIEEDSKTEIKLHIGDNVQFSWNKKEFFNFCKLLEDACNVLSDEDKSPRDISETINSIAKIISTSPFYIRPRMPFRSKFFHLH